MRLRKCVYCTTDGCCCFSLLARLLCISFSCYIRLSMICFRLGGTSCCRSRGIPSLNLVPEPTVHCLTSDRRTSNRRPLGIFAHLFVLCGLQAVTLPREALRRRKNALGKTTTLYPSSQHCGEKIFRIQCSPSFFQDLQATYFGGRGEVFLGWNEFSWRFSR